MWKLKTQVVTGREGMRQFVDIRPSKFWDVVQDEVELKACKTSVSMSGNVAFSQEFADSCRNRGSRGVATRGCCCRCKGGGGG